MSETASSARIASWGRYPPLPQTEHVCHWRSTLRDDLDRSVSRYGSTLPYGNGRSYGDSCLAASRQLLGMGGLDRFIDADWDQGVLRAEPGVTLAQILALAIPRGWFLAVTPGTQFATLGGAIANDVHGKNHHRRGTFGRHVLRFGLLRHSGQETMTCSPEENAALFKATIGGLGLTGVISWAEIRLLPIRSSQIDSTVVRFGNLAEFFRLSAELDHQHEYGVAWIDCLAKGADAGRGVYWVGDHADYGQLDARPRRKLTVPFAPPFSLMNHVSLRAMNTCYWRAHPAIARRQRTEHEPFFYPLDRILHWNRIYGRKGFQQYQCVIPDANAEPAIAELLRVIAESGQGSFLAVLKRCGDLVSPGLLSFPMAGTSLALDFAQHARLEDGLFRRLDRIVHDAGGRLYSAKDAHMNGSDFRQAYPAWEQLEALRDPALNSHFWQRVSS